MRAFNLGEAKAGKPLVTRDGRDAKFIAHVPECMFNRRVLVHIEKSLMVYEYPESGLLIDGNENACDIFMNVVRKTGYLNIWFGKLGLECSSGFHDTSKSAENAADLFDHRNYAVIAAPVEIEVWHEDK